MGRILIIGNTGAGKSWLSARLGAVMGVTPTPMDAIFWKPGGYIERREGHEIEAIISECLSQEHWLVEGVFGEIADRFLYRTDLLVYLAPPIAYCLNNLSNRFYTNVEQALKTDQVALLAWASEYNDRESKTSKKYHEKLYSDFNGKKVKLTTEQEISEFSREFRC